MWTHRHLLAALIYTMPMLGGCQDAATTTVPGQELEAPGTWTPATPESRPAPGLLPGVESSSRNTRRLTVDQLRRTIPDLFGGETWTMSQGRNTVDAFDTLSRTLGEADYTEVTESITEPSPLFQKFMDDMAAHMCSKAVAHDMSESDADSRWVVRNPADLDETLRFLRLKFHGIFVAPDAGTGSDGLGEFRQLFSDIEASAGMEAAWVGLCMAVLTAPEFMAY